MTLPAVLFAGLPWACLVALVTGGCVESGIPGRADTPNTPAGAQAGMAQPMEGVQVRLVVPDTVASGRKVLMTLRLTNTTSAVRELYLRGREITFDIAITDSSGSEIWRLLGGDPIPAILQLRALKPGETIELTHEWDQRTRRGSEVPDGVYTARAEVLTDGSSSLISNEERLVISRDAPPSP